MLQVLSTTLKHDLEVEASRHIPWDQFLDLTYGSLTHDPIERNPLLERDQREPIE